MKMNVRNLKCVGILLLMLVLAVGVFSMLSVRADAAGQYTLPVGETFQPYTAGYMDYDYNFGSDFLFVICRDGRYYAMQEVASSAETRKTIPAVDVTDWVNPDGSVTIPADTQNVAFFRLERENVDGYNYRQFITINGDAELMARSYTEYDKNSQITHYPYDILDEHMEFQIRHYDESFYKNSVYWSSEGNRPYGTLVAYESRTVIISQRPYQSKYVNVPYYVDLQSDGMGGYEFAFFSLPDQFDKLTGDEVNGYMYRLECRHQFEIEHQAYHAPTCTEKGCAEYWRCTGCGQYFQDAALENPHPAVLNPAGVYKPILGALGHNWANGSCSNCGRETPVFTKVTNIAQLASMPEGTLYLLAAEYNGQTYVLSGGDPAALANMTDANEDEWPDILSIDANGDGSPDCMEIDVDPANGVWDYLETNLYDTESDIVDWDDYYYYVEERMNLQSLADSVYSGNAYDGGLMNAIVVTPNPDGSIVLTDPYGISFEMISMVSEEDIQWQIDNEREWAEEEGRAFTEEDAQTIRMNLSHSKMMAMPNVWFQPYFCVTNRPYGEDRPMVGDQTSWLFYFYDDIKDETFETWDGELISVLPEDLKMSDGCVFINSTNDPYNWYPNYDDLDRTVRLRVLDGAIDFVGGSGRYDYDLYEWVSFESDEQICVYLYASAPADVHTHEWGEWTDNGNAETHVRICTDPECGATETRNHEWDEGVQTTPPNCTDPGVMIYTCITCGHEKEEAGADPTGHSFGDWSITKAPTCTEPGERRRECAECGIPEIQSLDALTHDYVPTVTEPTCTGDGFTTYTCSRCGDAYTDDFTDALGHNYETVVTEPTYESIGYTTYTCTRCGNTYTDDFVDPLVHHEVLEGENSAWCTAAGGDMEVRIDEQIHCFLEVGIDGMIVAPEYYTVSEGSTIVTIHEDYLKTLAVGKHTLEVRFTTGSAETDFLVTETPFTLGDVDGNGIVDLADAYAILLAYNGQALTDVQAFAGDVNRDGKVDGVDAYRIILYYTERTETLPETSE